MRDTGETVARDGQSSSRGSSLIGRSGVLIELIARAVTAPGSAVKSSIRMISVWFPLVDVILEFCRINWTSSYVTSSAVNFLLVNFLTNERPSSIHARKAPYRRRQRQSGVAILTDWHHGPLLHNVVHVETASRDTPANFRVRS